MNKFSVLIRHGGVWHAFYVWAADEQAAMRTARCHILMGVTVDRSAE